MTSIKGFSPSRQQSSSDGEPGTGSLPCLSSSIENNEELNSVHLLSPYHRKTADTLRRNIEGFIARFGINNVGFLTLTFADNVRDPKEAYRRFSSFRVGFLRRHSHFGEWICIKERQKRGAWHYHLIIFCGADIRTGIVWEKRKKRGSSKLFWLPVPSTVSPFLRSLWAELRKVLPRYSFGRSELLPIRTNVEFVSKYLGKYISKHVGNRLPEDKGVNLVSYSSKWVRSTSDFQWNNENSAKWRQSVRYFALCHDFEDMASISDQCGSNWAYRLADYIIDTDWKAKSEEPNLYIPLLREKLFCHLGIEDCDPDPHAVLHRLCIDPEFSLALVGKRPASLDDPPF
jgi:hypothetical protein